jgi:hypothetical protein
MSDDVVDRQKLIEEKIMKRDDNALKGLELIRERVWDFLIQEKGYLEGDIEVDRHFEIGIDDIKASISVDYLITLGGRRFMVVKCTPGALESRERHLVSFARVVDSYQIPLAVVTDGLKARVMDAMSGKLAGEDLTSMPDRSRAIEVIQSMEFKPYPHDKMEREKRILLAFEAIKCTEESCE